MVMVEGNMVQSFLILLDYITNSMLDIPDNIEVEDQSWGRNTSARITRGRVPDAV